MTAPPFSWSVSLGNVLEIAVILVTVTLGWASLDSRISALEAQQATDARLSVLEQRVAQNAKDFDSLENRLERMEAKLDRLLSRP